MNPNMKHFGWDLVEPIYILVEPICNYFADGHFKHTSRTRKIIYLYLLEEFQIMFVWSIANNGKTMLVVAQI